MSEKLNDGGPAFPVPGNPATQPGMSLRDWFAGQAMAAMVGSHQKHNLDNRTRGGSESLWDYVMPACEDIVDDEENGPEQMVIVAYHIADEMIRHRDRGAK